ncbi:hypothetical protein SNE40_010307 [Patella caerulea]|uniref:Mitochondrial nucleoid factor 1 n=1 Tax=Patella caerulea TaxID=87958 RepID=A0AAN8JU71_PATCE
MAASRYRLFMRLCSEWKLDETKAGRDLGFIIRESVARGFKNGEASAIDEEKCERSYNALQKLNSNYYREKYPYTRESASSGCSFDVLQQFVATETMVHLQYQDLSMFKKIKTYVKGEKGK